MRIAVLSDVHSNLEALQAALEYLERQRIDRFFFLGDCVGYGANPNECLEIISRTAGRCVAGNHEKALYDDDLLAEFSGPAREAILWTRQNLNPRWNAFLREMPYLIVEKEFTLVHGCVSHPENFEYLFYFVDALPSLEQLQTPLGFVGHTHVPQAFKKREQRADYLRDGAYALDRSEVYLLNPGSVGQPRDHDPRLACGILDTEAYEFRLVRLAYDNRLAARKIIDAGLPEYLGRRLL
ncbi:MAG: metallophosphoesterase family protein [Candidatus Omnitrophica bacterium]|nr:metallophosphoesterase family protein [Candidatus Omnitrophota bacterium]